MLARLLFVIAPLIRAWKRGRNEAQAFGFMKLFKLSRGSNGNA